jgi:hypothetical protein
MTTTASYTAGNDFEGDESLEDGVEKSASAKLLAAASLASWHLRRAMVFLPIFGVVFLLIGYMWLQGVRAESELNAQSRSLNILLDQPSPEPDLLLRQVDGWEAAYQVVLGGRVARPDDSDLIERVINAAADSGLVIVETGTTLDGVATIENESYTATPVLISAIGTMDGIESYLQLLETSEFAAFGVEAASIEEGLVAYQLTLRGLYYSLPENFGESDPDSEEESVLAATPVVAVDSDTKSGEGAAK